MPLSALSLLLWAPSALAADFVAGPPLVGDGATVHTLQVQSDDPAAKLKVKALDGRILERLKVPGGLVLRYVAPPTSTETVASFEIKVTGTEDENEAGTHTRELVVQPPAAGAFTFSFSADHAVPGQPVELTVTPVLPTTGAGARDLALRTSAGELSGWSGDGSTWTATWTPPADLDHPSWAVFAVADRNHPDLDASATVLPVHVDVEVQSPAVDGATGVLEVGGQDYTATASGGQLTFSVPGLSPALQTGRLTVESPDQKPVRSELALPGDPQPPAVLSPLPAAKVPTGTPVPMALYAAARDGSWTVPEVSWGGEGTLIAGSALTIGAAGPVFVDVIALETGAVTASALLPQGELSQTFDAIDGPVDVALALDPVSFPHDGRAVTVISRQTDHQGKPASRRLVVDATDAQLWMNPTSQGDGVHHTRFGVDKGANTSRITAWTTLSATGLPARHLLVLPASRTAQANGADTVRVVLLLTDGLGQPIPNQEFALAVPVGDGFLPPSVKSDRYGIAVVDFTAGREEGLVNLEVRTDGFVSGAGLWQVGPSSPPPIEVTGSPAAIELAGRWQSDLGRTTLTRMPKGPEVGPPAVVQIAADPPYAIAGTPVTITLVVTDEKGWPVTGENAAITPTGGSFQSFAAGPGPGQWTAVLTVPEGWSGPIDLAAKVDGVEATARLAPMVTRRRDQPVSGAVAASSTPPPVASLNTGKSQPTRQRVSMDNECGKLFRLRLMTHLSPTTYTAVPEGDADGFAPALALSDFRGSLAADAELWVLEKRNLGFFVQGTFSPVSWGTTDESLLADKSSMLLRARADVRYKFVQAGLFSAYGGLGFGLEQLPIFAWQNQAQISLAALTSDLMGARVAAGARLEWEQGHLIALELSELFAPIPVVSKAELMGDIRLAGPIGVHFGVGYAATNTVWRVGDVTTDKIAIRQSGITFQVGGSAIF